MITYNEAKQLLDQGIFPCLILYDSKIIDYIISYDDNELSCGSSLTSYTAENENSELSSSSTGGGAVINK